MAKTYSSFEELAKKEYGIEKNPVQPKQSNNSPQKSQSFGMVRFMQDGVDYVSLAEEEIIKLGVKKSNGQYDFGALTTSKIRNILSMVNDILKEVQISQESTLPPEIINKLKHLKVRLVYEAGRDASWEKNIKRFITDTGLLYAIDEINGNKNKFLRFANYLESLVAYHRYYGGRD
jgi:CRISPR type III-A-associated protein Csm2